MALIAKCVFCGRETAYNPKDVCCCNECRDKRTQPMGYSSNCGTNEGRALHVVECLKTTKEREAQRKERVDRGCEEAKSVCLDK